MYCPKAHFCSLFSSSFAHTGFSDLNCCDIYPITYNNTLLIIKNYLNQSILFCYNGPLS